MSIQVARGEYLWMAASAAENLIATIGQRDPFREQFDRLEDAFTAASDAAANWKTPQEIFEPLRAAGIAGAGQASIAYTQAVLAQQQRERAHIGGAADDPAVQAGEKLLPDVVTSMGSMFSTIVGLVQTIFRVTSLDITVRGLVMNASPNPLTYVFDEGPADKSHNPYLKNCRSVNGPLGALLPGRQQIADPVTRELQECVAVSFWSVANDQGHTGAFAAVLADMGMTDHNGNQYACMGWGVPYSGTERSIIQAGFSPDAEVFFDSWDTGRTQPESRAQIGASYIVKEKDRLSADEGRFLIVYRGVPQQ